MLTITPKSPAKTHKVTKSKTPASKITYIEKVIKGETYVVMAQSAVELEDEFSSLYFTATDKSHLFLMPPFEPNFLLNLVQTNNVLAQCVEAMEVNVDGTGFEFVPLKDGEEVDEAEQKTAKAFFDEPYPNLSFTSIRRKLRRQVESVGYGFLEILRSMSGEMVGLRNVETSHIRMVKLDQPIQVKKTVSRDDKEVTLTIWERERRFAQRVALAKMVYYREYGTTREINRDTGEWEKPDAKIPPELRGSELMIFGIHPDIITPYYLPRWINQLPSVIGSRNAEEQNLQFLDAGGMPPAIIFIQGGTLIKDTSDQLKSYLSGANKNKNRAVVVEVQSSSGSLDSASKVDTKVERFGSAQSQDAMFMKYDLSTEEHVRTGFRLPPLFIGKAADYNFATAQTAYMVAEAQVFLPERVQFDEMVNKTMIKELGLKSLKFKSLPITLKDVQTQLKGLDQAKDVATRESMIKEINTAAGTNLQLAAMPHPNVPDGQEAPGKTVADIPHQDLPASTKPPAPTSPQPEPEPQEQPVKPVVLNPGQKIVPFPNKPNTQGMQKQSKTAIELIDLAHDYAAIKGLIRKREVSPERQVLVEESVSDLSHSEMRAFNSLIATYAFGADDADLVSLSGIR